VFLQMLYDREMWKKWASRDVTKAANWAPLPPLPKVTTVVPAADKEPATWRYTTARPGADWAKPGFDDAAWKEGKSGFGTAGTPGAKIGTTWDSADIWLRREVELPAEKLKDLELWLHHDDDAEVFINGVQALRARGFVTAYESFALNNAGKAALKAGKNLIAVYCHQTSGGQYIDLGLVAIEVR
jgi:hypothetical protein